MTEAMLDFASFKERHPQLCNEEMMRIPGLVVEERRRGEKVAGWEEAYRRMLREDPWEKPPSVRPLMQERGAEAFGYYLSFRLEPERWGVYLLGPPLLGLAKEVLRVLNLGFIDLKDNVSADQSRELAFSMAFDVASNHLSFHATVDAFAASMELERGEVSYGPYLRGPYAESLTDPGGDLGYNLEEALANVVSLRSFLNPNAAVELGSLVNESLDEDGQYRWNAYLMSGNLTTELAYIMRAYPPGYRNFTEFLRRRGEVGPYAHMAIQYDLDTTAFNDGLRRLATIILGDEVEDAEKELVKPVPVSTYLAEDNGRTGLAD